MGEHKIKYVHVKKPLEQYHHGRCLFCGETSGMLATLQMVQDWDRKHQEAMERIRARAKAPPTDERMLQHYQKMAENPDLSEADRFQWKQLADQLGHRLHGEDKRYSGDVPLEL